MPLELSIDTSGIGQLENYYQGISDRLEDLKPIERELGDLQREELRLRFLSSPATEVGGVVHGDVYWDRLSDWYLNKYPRRRKGQIMIDTEKLKNDSTLDGSGNTSEFKDRNYTFTINTPYAQKQHNLRKLLFWSEGLLEKTEKAIVDYLITGKPNR